MPSQKQHRLQPRAANLRSNMTFAEKFFWSRIKSEQIGAKFRRQHIAGRYILDFYCPDLKLAIEVDGPVHEQQKAKDEVRDARLSEDGICVLRFQNHEIFTDLENVLVRIQKYLVDDGMSGS